MSNEKFREKIKEKQEQHSAHAEVQVCHSCSYKNDIGALFCEECGMELKASGRPCPECGELSSGERCGFCDAVIDGYTCLSCGAMAYRDFCPECGAPGTERALELLSPDPEVPELKEVLNDSEVKEIKDNMFSELSEEVMKEIDRMSERIIYMKEMEYAAERDRRIENYTSSHNGKPVQSISREEMAYIKETVERMQTFNKEEKMRNDEIIRLREEEEAKKREEERIKREKEQMAREESERLRREEERELAEKRRKEEVLSLLNGKWLYTARWGYCILKFVSKDGKKIHGTTFISCPIGENVNKISGAVVNDNNISFHVSGRSGKECVNHAIMKFSGTISGSMMNGYMNYKKKIEQGIFVKIK